MLYILYYVWSICSNTHSRYTYEVIYGIIYYALNFFWGRKFFATLFRKFDLGRKLQDFMVAIYTFGTKLECFSQLLITVSKQVLSLPVLNSVTLKG